MGTSAWLLAVAVTDPWGLVAQVRLLWVCCRVITSVRLVWCGVVWCGVVWCGVVWCGVVLGIVCDVVSYGVACTILKRSAK